MFHVDRITSLQYDLVIVVWTADSLLPHLEELGEFLAQQKRYVLFINETFLRPNDNVGLPKYVLYRDVLQGVVSPSR